MKSLKELDASSIRWVLTDIDDTLTDHGKLKSPAYDALWKLNDHGFQIVPITGRPAGWCEMIARFWPVDGVVGENGGLYFRQLKGQMKRVYLVQEELRKKNRQLLKKIEGEVLNNIPGAQVASDQFCRQMDLAIDFCEDVPPLDPKSVNQIVSIFQKHGAQAKVSSIHVNGWFGEYDKLSTCKIYFQNEHQLNLDECKDRVIFCGDSPNDEPMFGYFPFSVGVANVQNFVHQMHHKPQFVTQKPGGEGFEELSKVLIQIRQKKNYI